MPHNESQSVSRMKENFTYGLTGRGWEPTYDLVNKSLCNRKSRATGYQVYEARHQSFTLLVVLTQILAQAIETVLQLKSILENGADTLNLLRDVNSGVRSGLDLIRVINPQFAAGVYGDLRDPQTVLRALQSVYGPVPDGMDKDLISAQDQSVAEVISMNRNLYDYADGVDRERERILFHSQVVGPQGAGKLQNQALGVLIGVTTQLLRTQSQMLKIMAQNLAYDNRKEKLSTRNFQENYQGLSEGFKSIPKNTTLPRLNGGFGGGQ